MWADDRSCLDAHARSNDPERVLPDVSIIVPCYNAADTLPHTLASIRAQTLPNWEAVCVDDGSTDATGEILADHAAADARIRWTRGPHRCPAAARNAGVALARAARVLFLDADDSLRPTALEMLLQAAATAGAGGTLISAGYELLDEEGVPLGVLRFPGGGLSVDMLLLGNRLPAMTLVPRTLLGSSPLTRIHASAAVRTGICGCAWRAAVPPV
jgi:glycosyltransferase involved in cell wall biosynthesis